jgi:hypothetical protein
LAVLLAATVAPLVQDPKPVGTPDGETLRQALALASKTAEHERLAKLAGKWQVAVRTRRTEGGDMSEDRGTVVGQAILGGRYVVLNYQLKLQGRPVEAVQIVGFDTLRNAYTSSWRDSESTWSVECLGGIGKDADVLTLSGSLRDAKSPDGRDYRLTFDLRSKDRVTVRMHEARGLDEVLLQEQDWQR